MFGKRKKTHESPVAEVIPIKPLSKWLADYAMPPFTALVAVGCDVNRITHSKEEIIKAWEFQLQQLVDYELEKLGMTENA